LGAEKWMTLPSLLNMLTSSIAWMGWTLSFLRAAWSFLSSVPAFLWTFLTFLRGVPLPLWCPISLGSSVCRMLHASSSSSRWRSF
jgi:hypothetical protein